MNVDLGEKSGWIFVTLQKPIEWKLPTFFPLVDAMYKQIKTAYEEDPRPVVFDLTTLDYIDSTVVSLFLQTVRLTGETRNAMLVQNNYIRDLINLLGIDKLLDIYDNEEEWDRTL